VTGLEALMGKKSIADEDRVAAMIGRYVAKHPGAADTVEGVMHWWLPDPAEADVVHRALERLVAQRVLLRRRLPGGELVYCAIEKGRDEC
jgi:hypothetical protein